MNITVTATLTLLLFSLPACATLQILADYGGESTAPYYRDFPEAAPQPVPAVTSPSPLQAAGFPVSSPSLSPGDVMPRAFSLPGMIPLFLAGDDERSRRWLAGNAAELARMRATGVIVNVTSPARLKALAALAPGVNLIPASGEEMVQRLGIQHYPVLVYDRGLSQQVTP